MIHYNPELHYGKVMDYLTSTDAWVPPTYDLNTRHRRDGTPIIDIEIGDETIVLTLDTFRMLHEQALKLRELRTKTQVRNILVNLSECEIVTEDYMPSKETMHMDWS